MISAMSKISYYVKRRLTDFGAASSLIDRTMMMLSDDQSMLFPSAKETVNGCFGEQDFRTAVALSFHRTSKHDMLTAGTKHIGTD